VKRAVLLILLIAAIGGGVLLIKNHRPDAKPAEEKPAEESRIKHDENGRVLISMDDETQGNMGILVAKPSAAQLSLELKGYGRVVDPAPLALLVTELALAQAVYTASSNELARVKSLAPLGNASERVVQAAEAVAQRDRLAIVSAQERLRLTWGTGVVGQKDLPGFVQELTSQNSALVRIDLPAGEILKSAPSGARIVTLSSNWAEVVFLGTASNVDPQTLGQGSIFLLKPNKLRLVPGEPVTGYIKLPGEPLAGVTVVSDAVVRTEGGGWVYVLNSGGDGFIRTGIALDHPTEGGWFVGKGVTTEDYLVVTGAQTLLSEELKASLKPD
jgi:hypothetical protein